MTRDELEARIWYLLTAMICSKVTQGEFVDDVLAAADQYAVTQGGITAERRAVLAEAAAPRRRT